MLRAKQARKMRGLGVARVRLVAARMPRNLMGALKNRNLVIADQDLDRALDEDMRHAIANRIDIDEAVIGDATRYAALTDRQRAWQGAQRRIAAAQTGGKVLKSHNTL